MDDWATEAKIMERATADLLAADVPDGALLDCLNAIQRTLDTLYEMRRAMLQRMRHLAETQQYVWKETDENERADTD